MAESSPLSRASFPPSAGTKRPASALLPAFEPCSSPPNLPHPAKRVAREFGGQGNPLLPSALSDDLDNKAKYPTPVPTSETNIFSSSPPFASRTRRPALQRTVSTLSQRAPLGAVPTAELDVSGTEMLFGRSGKSSHFQLHSLNKNISRVHLRAAYVPAAASDQPARVEILCMGWNGMKVHCQGQHWEMSKHDSFTSEAQGSDIMVDIADTRVVIQWPKVGRKVDTPETSDEELDVEESPSRRAARSLVNQNGNRGVNFEFKGSGSPKSSKHNNSTVSVSVVSAVDPPTVEIYEDQEDDHEAAGDASATQASTQILSQYLSSAGDSFLTQEFSDADEENDPVVHSFGPMGANLLPKLASFHAGASPDQRRPLQPLKQNGLSPGKTTLAESSSDIKSDAKSDAETVRKVPARIIDVASHPVINHVVNQLAFNRLNQMPLSMIMSHLPSDLKTSQKDGQNINLSFDELRELMSATNCIGEVTRVGKDAAGMQLESEYYYIPENDFDESRKEAVVGQLRKPGLRACRKQHKQYFWRKPK